jgi:hypothetical protein
MTGIPGTADLICTHLVNPGLDDCFLLKGLWFYLNLTREKTLRE